MCINREELANELFLGHSRILDTYTLPAHPLSNPEVKHYEYDPVAASELLTSVGWIDHDNNATTPRVAQGIPGVQDGISFEVDFLTSPDEERQRSSQFIEESLAQCGIQANVTIQDWGTLLAPGPEGPIFGRDFDMAQFGWTASLIPPCFLYLSDEIPGPYPEFIKSWGGVNAPGYSSSNFDENCQVALSTLPESRDYQRAHYQAQAIFAEDLPSIPLYTHFDVVVTRPDMCGVIANSSSKNAFWNLEEFDYGENCMSP
jgi:peptide/nickel transport system substrate-binding protein